MYGKWMCFALLVLVIVTCSNHAQFYHDHHTTSTSHDKNPWDWGQSWQQDWATTRPTRRRTTTAKVKTSTPVPTLPTLPQPTIRDVEIRLGETTTVNSPTPSPRPITLIQEDIPSHVKEQDKTSKIPGPIRNSDSFQSDSGENVNSDSKPIIQAETSAAEDGDKTPESENTNTFGIAVIGDVGAADDSEIEPEDEGTSFTKTEDSEDTPQIVAGPEDTGSFQIGAISTVETEAKPAETETSSNSKRPNHLLKIDKVLDAIQGTGGKVGDQEPPLLTETQSMWHVAIYEKKKAWERFEHICGGSLVKPDIVISAGHCFWPGVKEVPTPVLRVAAGKLYPRYDDPRDKDAQYSETTYIAMSDMVEPCLQPDFAIVSLATPFRYTSTVRPVCFSLDQLLEFRQLREGNAGVVASWAALENGACRSLGHSWLTLPFVGNKVCQYVELYKTTGSDRICAGRANDTTECATNRGNGLVFFQDKIPYLRGVSTSLPVHQECARFYTRSFANIVGRGGILKEYFKPITDMYDLGECENLYRNYPVQNRDGQKNETSNKFGDGFVQIAPPNDEPKQVFSISEIGAKPAPTLPGISAPALQWHVGVYSTLWAPYKQICGGSLVKRDFVVSAAHCFWDDATGQLAASQFAVAGGKIFRPWNNTQDTYVQHSEISEIILPARFRGGATSFQDDVAVLRLFTPFTYAPGVQSVCVDFSREFERQQLRPGHMGTILGWGLTEENGSPSQRLTYLELPYVDVDECFADSEPAFLKYITSDKICAGDTVTGKALCRGDSGGGFVLYSNNTPYLHGIASTAAVNDKLCNAFAIAAFTSLYSHRAFLRDNIPGIEKECVKPETTTQSTLAGNVEAGNVGGTGVATETTPPVYTNVPYFPYPNHFVCNCNCKP